MFSGCHGDDTCSIIMRNFTCSSICQLLLLLLLLLRLQTTNPHESEHLFAGDGSIISIMFAKVCRGALSSKILVEFVKRDRAVLNVKQCFSNHVKCYPIASRGSVTALVPHYVQWTPKRFRSKLADETKAVEEAPKLTTNARTQRRRNKSKHAEKGYPVVAFSTAEEYNLESLKDGIAKQQLYSVVEEEEEGFQVQESDHQEDVVHIKARYTVDDEPREVFFFREGTAVFWNVSDLEVSNFLRFLTPFEVRRYNERLVLSEREYMSYIHSESKKTLLRNDVIELSALPESSLEKYSFSNGVALSVKLGIWEASLEKFIESIEFIGEDLKAGRKIRMTREEVLRKQGELFAMRHSINLSSDLLDTPDFYWDNEELERLFLQTINYYCISRRTRVMNEKISHCAEMMELVSSHLSDKHHIRLEWMIIVLIMVEVGFEFLHFMK